MPAKLTAPAIAKAPARASRYEIADLGQPGLRLVIQPSGAKSWAYRYERPDGTRVKITLGPATGPGALSLAEARLAANDAMRLRFDGVDPAAKKRAARTAEMARIGAEEKEARRRDDTVALVLDRYCRDKVNAMKSAPELKRLLNKELSPWAKRRVDDIDRTDAIKLIDAVKDRGTPVLANRTRAAARTFFGWCMDKALIEENPFERTKPVTAEKARDHILSDEELRRLWISLDRCEWIWRAFYRLLILTGQRRDEVAGMAWSEIDLGSAVWVLPAARSKNGREHTVPLPASAVAILRSLPRIQIKATINGTERHVDSPLVLTTTGKTPISGFSRDKLRLDKLMKTIAHEEAVKCGDDRVEIEPWRIHDLRRTVASGMARLGIGVAVAEKVMNHVSGTFAGIVGVYQRHDFLAEKRHALNLWADHVAGLTTARESNVVRLNMGE